MPDNSVQHTMGRKTRAIWPIALGFAFLCMVLTFVFAFSFVGLAFFLLGIAFLVIFAGDILSNWTPKVWHGYALVLLTLLVVVGVGSLLERPIR